MMSTPDTEDNPWLMTPEKHKDWEEALRRELAAKHATPEYQRRKKDIERLSGDLAVMLYPNQYPTCTRKSSTVHVMGRAEMSNKECGDAEPAWKKQDHTFQAFHQYGTLFRSKSPDQIADAGGVASLGIYRRLLIEDAKKELPWPFKVGASLYIYQQMYDRQLSPEPSLSKAQWLVTNAPLKESMREAQPSRGEPRKIGEQWKNYFKVSHFWAAFAALTETPLVYSETALLDFICYGDADEFTRLAASFLDFRKRVEIAFINKRQLPYIKQELEAYSSHLEDVPPKSPLDITNPLADFQWSALSQYQSHLRKPA